MLECQRSEVRTWHRKVKRDVGFSLCAVPSQDSCHLNLQEVRGVVKRQTRECKQVECLIRYLLYFTVPHGFPWSPHGVLLESLWSPHGLHEESTWSPCGVLMDSMRTLHGFLIDSTQNPQILWRVHGFWVDYDKFW